MNFEEVVGHHLLDHAIGPFAAVGGIRFGLSKHLLMMWINGSLLLVGISWLSRGRSKAAQLARMAVEMVVLFIRDDIVEPILGHAGRPYLHYFLTLFFFILLCNLAGLVPYGATATGNIAVTAALASCTFALIVLGGIREQGLSGFLKHIVPGGLPWWILPIMFVVEISGLFAKCFALTIRLFANMIAGHIVALGFLSLIFTFGAASRLAGLAAAPFSVAVVVFVNALEVLVCLLQAYIFTMLTAVFVGGALHPH
ncbi:MAG: F0F1 ATP synthase subunit A [Elusimicrobia bacterium]|nr:F0F1 ATP synthase subunit A [Elusimicrobiota bacterium]